MTGISVYERLLPGNHHEMGIENEADEVRQSAVEATQKPTRLHIGDTVKVQTGIQKSVAALEGSATLDCVVVDK